MNYLITGGCGFVGVNLVKRLLKNEDNNIRVIDDLSVGLMKNLLAVQDSRSENRVEFCRGDIRDELLAMDICKDIDVIIHLAANTGVPVSVEFPREDCIANILGTLNYLEGARHNKVKRFIFASSSAVPGDHIPPYHEKLFARPIAPYGASKAAAESYCHVYNATYGVETVALRFSNVYGPFSDNKKAQLISHFIQAIMDKNPLVIFGDGSQTRDFCFVDDLMDAIESSISTPDIGGHVFQIATNIETPVQTITDIILDIFREGYCIENIEVVYTDERSGDVSRNFSDVNKAKELLKWKSKVSVEEGIDKTIEWYIKNYYGGNYELH